MSAIDTPAQRRLIGDSTRRGARLSCQVDSLAGPGRPLTVLSMTGEIDTCTELTAANAVSAAVDYAPGPVVVDLAGLSFCSAGGLGLLAAPTGTADGHAYVLAGMSPHLHRVTALLWPDDRPVRYPHTAAAITALHAAPTPPPPGTRSSARDHGRLVDSSQGVDRS